MKKLLICLLLVSATSLLYAQQASPVGRWLVPDPRDGKPWLIVNISETNGQLQAVLSAYPKGSRFEGQKKCSMCPSSDPRKNAPMAGLKIVTALKPLGTRYVDGEYLDLENGRVYNCNFTRVTETDLWVEVAYGRMYRKQVWKRVN